MLTSLQVLLISDSLKKKKLSVAVRSVDGFQGQERDVIISSTVRANENRFTGFLDDSRRLNVLLTRARRGLVLIGHKKTLEECESWKNLLDYLKMKNAVNGGYKSECRKFCQKHTITGLL